ncbi:MAG: acyl carrier protein [Saprospiraceae bacterium]|nr:acyl carrier protein [Saprospiraceae bacterium]
MEDLIHQLKADIIEQLNLVDVNPDDIQPDTPLFGEGLGLDSIDSLEISVLLERKYQVKITNSQEGRKVFQSIRTLAEFITERRAAQTG